jgi:hypothetical protein
MFFGEDIHGMPHQFGVELGALFTEGVAKGDLCHQLEKLPLCAINGKFGCHTFCV